MAKPKRKWNVAWVKWDPARIQRYLDDGWTPFAATGSADSHYPGPTICFRRKAGKA